MTANLLTAALAAAARIEAAAADCGSSYSACQTYYGVGIEVLTGGEWVKEGDVEQGAEAEAVRFYDCDGERGAGCETPAAVEAEAAKWIETLDLSVQNQD